MIKKISISNHIILLFIIYAFGLLIFGSFRLALLFFNSSLFEPGCEKFIIYALFNRGLLFDSYVMCYSILLPFLLLSIIDFLKIDSKALIKPIIIFFTIIFLIIILISSADIPLFSFYNSRINRSVFNWTENISLMFKELFYYKEFYTTAIVFVILATIIFIVLKKYVNIYLNNISKIRISFTQKLIQFIICGLVLFIGIRGDYKPKKAPLVTHDAYFCDYSFINQLGINPVFNFIDSYRDFTIKYYSDKDAIFNVQQFLNIKAQFNSPVAREIKFSNNSKLSNGSLVKPNVVIVIMESMAACQMERFGNQKHLTPFLDSLANVSLSFENIYASGEHTYNGLFATLFGMPSVMQNKPTVTASSVNQKFSGISNILKNYGYQTLFFCTGDKKFDNMGGFLSNNDFNKIISEIDYPADKISNGWGVADDVMYDYSIKYLNSTYNPDKPFLAVLLSISAHEGGNVPENIEFKTRSEENSDKIYEYSDWALSKFMQQSARQPWFKNTIFVFVADHGQNFDPMYDIPLTYHHIPFIINSSSITQSHQYDNLGSQVDVIPTLMGVLKLPYINNTLGIDLQKESRQFTFFTADDKIGCIDNNYFLIINNSGKEGLYKFKNKDRNNYIESEKNLVNKMKKYTYSMIQTTQWLIEHKKVSLPIK